MKRIKEKFSVTENKKRVPVGTYVYPVMETLEETVNSLGMKDTLSIINECLKKFSRDLAAETYKANKEFEVSEKRKLAQKWEQGKLSKVEVQTLKMLGYSKPEELLRKKKNRESLRTRVIGKLIK